jgi:hypothetical protein
MDMCKYANDSDIGYQRTSGHVIELVDEEVKKRTSSRLSVPTSEDAGCHVISFISDLDAPSAGG